ncbi:MAG: ComEC/Rec2 family competence protein [Edaphobacter sp.]|nr:ComEC/Rec2 family competence protein [Edaphobacter sp.]MDE1176581.1 ComEC/Rec2 family competence protein [Edaphobacter sp.]
MAIRFAERTAMLALVALWVAAGAWSWQLRPLPLTQHELQQYADGLSRQVRGRIIRVRHLPSRHGRPDRDTDSTWWEEHDAEEGDAVSIDIAVDAVEEVTPDISRMVPITGGVRVTMLTDTMPYADSRCGDGIELPLRLKVPVRFRDPGVWQYADYLLAQGIGVEATAHTSKARSLAHHSNDPRCLLAAAQNWSSARMLTAISSPAMRRLPSALRLSGDDAAMLNAMLFGDRSRLTQQVRAGFVRTGSFHLFVVSGMHVAVVAGILLWILHRLRIRAWIATLLALSLTTAYALITGFGAPVQRALFMTAIFLAARLLARERSVLNAIGAAALAELIWSPGSLFDAGFQMTFLAVLAIAGIAVPLAERSFLPWLHASQNLDALWLDPVLPPRLAQLRMMLRMWRELLIAAFGRWCSMFPALALTAALHLLELAWIALVAEMVMALPMALYFHRATFFALPANMLTIPVIGLLVPLSLLFFFTSLLAPALAVLPAAATAALLHSMEWAIAHVSKMPHADIRIPGPAAWAVLLALTVWAFCLYAARRSTAWALAAALCLPIGTLLVFWPEPPIFARNMLEVTAIDVGQGDAIFVADPRGRTMLVDAGGPIGRAGEAATAAGNFDIGEEIVSTYLWSRRIRRLDTLVLSHAHSDHMGGMAAVMRNLRPRELWVSIDTDSTAYRNLLAEAAELGITVRHLHAGNSMPWGDTQIQVLSPTTSYINRDAPRNDDSLVLRIEYGSSSALLEGDAEAASEQAMLHQNLHPVTLLKIGHHGSKTSTTAPFLNALHPRDAIVSVGRRNTFGHPRVEVIQRIAAAGARLYRTDEFGLTSFLLDHDGGIREHVASLEP